MLTCTKNRGNIHMFTIVCPLKCLDKQAMLSAWELWYDSAYIDNCWHVQKFLAFARHSHVLLAVGSLEYPEINKTNWHLSSWNFYFILVCISSPCAEWDGLFSLSKNFQKGDRKPIISET